MNESQRIARRGLWLTFDSAEMEEAYYQENRNGDRNRATLLLAVVALVFLVFVRTDYCLFGATAQFAWLMAARLFAVFVSAVALARVRRSSTRRHLEWTLLVWFLIVVVVNSYTVSTRPPSYAGHALPVVTVVCLGFLLAPSPWVVVAVPAIVRTVIYAIMYSSREPLDDGLTPTAVVTSLLAISMVGGVWSLQQEYWKRRHFAAHRGLQHALAEVKTLRGILPICSYCKRVRDDAGSWAQVEVYVRDHTHVEFSHGICPQCLAKHYSEPPSPSQRS